MSHGDCSAPIPPVTLLGYWLGELDDAADAQLDEHLLGCGDCSGQLQALVELGDGIRKLARSGRLRGVFTDALPKRLAESELHVREYRVLRESLVAPRREPHPLGSTVLIWKIESPPALPEVR